MTDGEMSRKAEGLCSGLIAEEGFETVEVKLEKGFGGRMLVFYIYSPDGVSVNDCERVQNRIEPVLDEADISEGRPYFLSVSSMGLDRPIRTPKDYLRLKGKEISLKLYAPDAVDGKKEFIGTIGDCTEEKVTLLTRGGSREFMLKDVAVSKQTI